MQQADTCVACGMCLPHCPTYQLTQSESESPRGRVSLIKGYLQNQIEVDDILIEHLDHCLLCRNCESICPADVPFAHLMDKTRARLLSRKRKQFLSRIFLLLLAHKRFLNKILVAASLIPFAKIRKLISGSQKRLSRYMSVASRIQPMSKLQKYYPATQKSEFTVALFTGCLESSFNANTVIDTINVLNILGINVHVPAAQQCCGAMHLHAGDDKTAWRLSQKNLDVFSSLEVQYVIGISTACTDLMIEQQNSVTTSQPCKFIEISSFLEEIKWHQIKQPNRLSQSIYLHYPCSQRNGLESSVMTKTLLERIPELEITELSGNQCCGAAGMYMFDYPDWSDRLRSQLLSACEGDCHTIVTSNLGCLLHFQQAGNLAECEVIHPVNLLSSALGCNL